MLKIETVTKGSYKGSLQTLLSKFTKIGIKTHTSVFIISLSHSLSFLYSIFYSLSMNFLLFRMLEEFNFHQKWYQKWYQSK